MREWELSSRPILFLNCSFSSMLECGEKRFHEFPAFFPWENSIYKEHKNYFHSLIFKKVGDNNMKDYQSPWQCQQNS